MSETAWEPSDFARQAVDGHFFLADEMVHKYALDPIGSGWAREADWSGWRSPYHNPWAVIHIAEQSRVSVSAAFPPPNHMREE